VLSADSLSGAESLTNGHTHVGPTAGSLSDFSGRVLEGTGHTGRSSITLGETANKLQGLTGHPQRFATSIQNTQQDSDSASNQPGISLDLTSTQSTIDAGQLTGFHPESITVGSSTLNVTASTLLTPGELVAVEQTLTGSQSIVLGASGNATGGNFVIKTLSNTPIASLVIPSGVTVTDNVSRLTLSGSLLNNGSILAVAANSQATVAVIKASDILNTSSGLISSASSSSQSCTPSLDLVLSSQNSITNQGTITSSGSLTLHAVGSITNAVVSESVANAGSNSCSSAPIIISAVNNVNLRSDSGAFVNHGLVQAQTGNINFTTGKITTGISAPSITLDNTNGTLQAANGAINFRDPSFNGTGNLTLSSGNYLSQALNLNSGTGTVTGNLVQVTGTVNVNAGEAHVVAATPNLKFGTLNVSGDPTYYNTTGSITLASAPAATNGNSLAFIAAQDVIISSGTISTINSSGGAGGSLTIVAGADIRPNSGSGGPDTTATFAVAGPSATGGAIVLTGTGSAVNPSINTQGVLANNAGGAATLIAYNGSGVGSPNTPGTIIVPNAISTGGVGTGTNGNVTIIAGATSGAGISVNAINTASGGSSSATGTISLSSATPSSANVTIANGAITGGSFTAGASAASAITIGALTTNGAAISASSGAALTVTGPITSATGGSIGLSTANNGAIAINGNLSTGSAAAGSITVNANGSGTITGTGTLTTGTCSLTSGIGAIGLLNTSTLNMAVNTTGDVKIENSGAAAALALGASTGKNFTLTNDRGINIEAAVTTGGLLSLTTTANNGAIDFIATSSGVSGVTLSANGTGLVSVGAGKTLSTSNNSPITITAGDTNFAGSLYAGTGIVSLLPDAHQNVAVASTAVFAGDFNVLAAALGNISAGTLVIGQASDTGLFTTHGNIAVSAATGPGQYNLILNSGGNFTNQFYEITLGGKTLNVTAGGSLNTGSIVSSKSTTVNLTAGNTITVSSVIYEAGTPTTGAISLTTTSNGSIVLNDTISNGGGGYFGSLLLSANGKGTISGASLLTAKTMTLSSGSGVIGPLNTQVSNLTADTTGNVTISNSGTGNALTLGASSGNNLTLTNDQAIVVNGPVAAGSSVAITTTGGFHIAVNQDISTNSTTTGTINLTASGTGVMSGTGTVTAGTVNLTSGSGAINITTSTTNLTANTTGNVTVNNAGAGAALVVGASTGKNVELTNDQTINVNGGMTASGTLSIGTNANNGNIVINSSSSGSTGITLSATGTGIVDVTAGQGLSTVGNSPISITAGDANLAGSVNAGTGLVSILPSANQPIIVGAAGTSAGALNVSSNSLANITAGKLVVGTLTAAGGLSTGGNLDVSAGAGSGQYNLAFNTGGTYSNTGNTITLGAKTLNVTSIGIADTGTITSSVGTVVNITSGNTLTIGGNITLGTTAAGGTISLTTTSNNGSILVNNVVSAGSAAAGSIAISADGSGSITGSGTLTSKTLSLLSGSGSIGLGYSVLNIKSSTLSANSLGNVYLQNTGAVSLNASTGANFSLTSSGNIATAGNVSADNGSLTLATTGASTVTASNALSATQNVNLQGAGGITVNNAVSISAGQIGASYSASEISYNSYNMTAFTSLGAITLTTINGNIQVGNNNTWTSLGGSVGAQTGANNSITVGTGNTFFAQGGNVYFNAGKDITIPAGTTIKAIGRAFPISSSHPSIVIDGATIADFQGGSVGIDAGTIKPNYDNYLYNMNLSRTANGTLYISGNVTTAGYTPSVTNGGTLNLVAPETGSLNVSNSTLTANGAVINFDPNGVINASNITIIAAGPSLAPIPAPPTPPTPTPVIPTVPTTPSVGPEAGLLVTTGGVKLAKVIPPVLTLLSDNQEDNNDIATSSAIATDVTKRIKPSNVLNSNPAPCVLGVVMNRNDAKKDSYFMSDSIRRPFYLTDKRDSGFFAIPGSLFKLKDDNTVELSTGRVVVMAGSKSINLQLKNGNVTISPAGTAVVEQNSNGVDRIANLSAEEVSLEIKGAGKTSEAKSGEEYVLADSSLNEEELIPVDDVSRTPIDGGKIVVSGKLIQKQNIDVNRLLSKEKWLYLNTDCFSTSLKLRLEKIRKQLQLAGNNSNDQPELSRKSSDDLQIQRGFGEQKSDQNCKFIGAVQINPFENNNVKSGESAITLNSVSISHPQVVLAAAFLQASNLTQIINRTEVIKPSLEADSTVLTTPLIETTVPIFDSNQELAYGSGAISVPANLLNSGKTVKMTTETYEISHMGDAAIKVDDTASVLVEQGELLVRAKRRLKLSLGKVNLVLKPDTIVLIKKDNKSVHIQVLWDKSDHSAELLWDTGKFALSSGEEAIVGFEDVSFVEAFAADHLARRRVNGIKLTDKITGVHSEIHLDEILLSNRILLNLFKAEGDKSELLKKLVKMAACVEEATAQHGDYERL
jgi:hypothetical protein